MVDIEGDRISVTVSEGATIVVKGDSTESVIKRVDELMYKSKENGRNILTMD